MLNCNETKDNVSTNGGTMEQILKIFKQQVKIGNKVYQIVKVRSHDDRVWVPIKEINESFLKLNANALSRTLKDIPKIYIKNFVYKDEKEKFLDVNLVIEFGIRANANYDVMKIFMMTCGYDLFCCYPFDILADTMEIVANKVNGIKDCGARLMEVENVYQDLLHKIENDFHSLSSIEQINLVKMIHKLRVIRRERKNTLQQYVLYQDFIKKHSLNINSIRQLNKELFKIRNAKMNKTYNQRADPEIHEKYLCD